MEVGAELEPGAERTAPGLAVTVRLHLGLRQFRPRIATGLAVPVSVPVGTTVAGVVADVCGLPDRMRVLVTVNGQTSRPDDLVGEGDQIRLFLPLSGG